MESKFTAEFFTNNRLRLRELFTGTAPIVVSANGLMQRNSDMAFPFRQDSSFWYLTGLELPNAVLVMDKDKEYLILSDTDDIHEFFNGSPQQEKIKARSGITDVFDGTAGWKKLDNRIKKVKHIATLAPPPAFAERFYFYTNPSRSALFTRIKEVNPNIEFLELRQQLTTMRMFKQSVELESIQQSIDLTVKTFKSLKKRLSKMSHEYELDAFITHEYRRNGAMNGYGPIVASGSNAHTIHYESNNSALDQNGLLLIDTGAEFEYYSADITRTYSLKTPTKRQVAVFDAVHEAHLYGLDLVRQHKSIKENEQLMEQFIGEKLRALGLIKSIERETVRKYYPHGLSHFLGLDLHDIGDYDRPLEPGMVLTVEPGIYIPEEGIGVRIEDDVLVTLKGIKVLSSKLPRELW